LSLFAPEMWPQNASVLVEMPEGVQVAGPVSVPIRVVIANMSRTEGINITVNATALDGMSRNATSQVIVEVPEPDRDGQDINWTLVALAAVAALLVLFGIGYVIKSRFDKNKPQDIEDVDESDLDAEKEKEHEKERADAQPKKAAKSNGAKDKVPSDGKKKVSKGKTKGRPE
jgi:hypothetical protein